MNAKPDSTGTVVVGVDGSESAERALLWAAGQAQLENRPLTVLHSSGTVTPSEAGWMARAGISRNEVLAAMAEEGGAVLDHAVGQVTAQHPDLDVRPMLQDDLDGREALLEASNRAALLVIGSRGRGPLKSLLLGSVGVSVARHARCPVVVLRPQSQGERHGVAIGTDCSEASRDTLEFGFRLAAQRDLPVSVVYCFGDLLGDPGGFGLVPDDEPGLEPQRLLLAETVSGFAERFPDVQVRHRLARGLVEVCLIAIGSQMDVVVMGRQRSSLADGLGFGSRTVPVLEHAGCAVAIVPEDL